jgi:uncharacterized membrane protein
LAWTLDARPRPRPRPRRPGYPLPARLPPAYLLPARLPAARPFLLAAVAAVAVLIAFLQVGIVTYALRRLGIAPQAAALVLLACLLGSAVNIPVARFRNRALQLEPVLTPLGTRRLVPVLRTRPMTLAVNLGGALIPAALSAYLIVRDQLGWTALLAIAIVALLVHLVARPIPGRGIAVPTLLPAVFAVLTASVLATLILHPVALASLAYVSGTLGTLVGADLANLGKLRRPGAPVASIGGAGTFDGVFLAGIIAVLLAALLL